MSLKNKYLKTLNALKSPFILLLTGEFNSVCGDLNQYKIVVSLFGAAYANFLKLISLVMDSSISEVEF